jgi:hypothetical protein
MQRKCVVYSIYKQCCYSVWWHLRIEYVSLARYCIRISEEEYTLSLSRYCIRMRGKEHTVSLARCKDK